MSQMQGFRWKPSSCLETKLVPFLICIKNHIKIPVMMEDYVSDFKTRRTDVILVIIFYVRRRHHLTPRRSFYRSIIELRCNERNEERVVLVSCMHNQHQFGCWRKVVPFHATPLMPHILLMWECLIKRTLGLEYHIPFSLR